MSQAAQNPWADFAELRDWIKVAPNVNQLKFIIEGLNTEVRQTRVISKYGKKQQLVDRLVAELEDWHVKRNLEAWTRASEVVRQVRETRIYTPKRGPPAPLSAMQPHPIHPAPSSTANYATKPYPYAGASSAGSLSYGAYPNPNTARIGQSSSMAGSPRQQDIRFASSPFMRVDQLVSKVVECLESVSAMDRRSQVVNFTLTPDQAMKLLGSPPKYQLRLFCTSSSYYSPNRPSNTPCQIEFPPTCEVRVNETLLNANLKGLKKKPGTAPPANLGSQARHSAGASTKVEMVYVNSQQPVHKKYYLAVQLVETFSVESIVERIRKGKFRSREEVLATMKQSSAQLDDEIEAGPQKMSLKCPLSYIRIQVPARSIKCVHPQCFDATSWFSMMEQTTTWLCPVCEKTLNVEEIIVDGYFDDILKSTHEDVEDVMVEADGEWHTQDNKYASAAWKSKLPPPAAAKAPAVSPSNAASSSPAASSLVAAPAPTPPAPRASALYEVYEIFDSDDEVDASTPSIPSFPPSVRHTSTSVASSSTASSARRPPTAEVIDLTLSDSEDDEPPARPAPPAPIAPVIRRVDKRKERDSPSSAHPGSDSAKRARTDSFPPPPPPTGYQTGTSSASSASSSSTFRPALDYPYGPTYGANTAFNYAGLAVTPGAAAGPLYNRSAPSASRRSSTSSAADLDRFYNGH